MTQPLLSIGMIVKNEERSLEKCLKALEPLRQAIPCELVIADTGSTDKTKEIAEKYADILFDFTWVNDFSKARNAVMDRCSGKWYLTVDADEYLASDCTELVNFLTGKNSVKMKEATIIQRNHFDKNMDGTYSDFNAKRMCRMDTGTRYTNPIHEYFNIPVALNEIYILTNTIFDHDGYANISAEHKREKEARNLNLLETELKNEPDNLRVILQCLESSAHNDEKRKFYTQYGIRKLKEVSHKNPHWETCAPNCAKRIALYLNYDNDIFAEEWFNWCFKTFPHTECTSIDIQYLYTQFLNTKERYKECIISAEKYLNNLKKHSVQNNTATLDKITSSLSYCHDLHKCEIQFILANAKLKENNETEFLNVLCEINLNQTTTTIIDKWFSVITDLEITSEAIDKISKKITSTLEETKDTPKIYEALLKHINNCFSVKTKNTTYTLFSEVSGTIGLSSKIADAKTKENAQEFIHQIENWENFMPKAFKQALILNVDFPSSFYRSPQYCLINLINSVQNVAEEIVVSLTEYYCNNPEDCEFPQVSFIFNLLSLIIFEKSLKNESREKLLNKLLLVAEVYLNSCYNPDLLKDENNLDFISPQHSFFFLLLKAFRIKAEKQLEYIHILKSALKKLPQSKILIEFLIENFKNEEKHKKQEELKKATPELVAMAEQLKIMLSALPPDSPQLMAIKQSPAYKQVAFLIEN